MATDTQQTSNIAKFAGENPEEIEVAAGREREQLEGWIPEFASESDVRLALEKAFDSRGDVTITRKDGTQLQGYVFDRLNGSTLSDSYVRLIPAGESLKIRVPYSDITALAFTGRDTAAGKTFEAWVKKYWEKKAAGEKNIQIEPEKLD